MLVLNNSHLGIRDPRLKSTAIWGMQVIHINAACRALAGSVWSTIRFLAKAIMTGHRVSAIPETSTSRRMRASLVSFPPMRRWRKDEVDA